MKKNDTIIENEALPTSVDKELFYYDNCWRVKVFELNLDSSWADCGTGLAGIIQQVSLYFPFTLLSPTLFIERDVLYSGDFRDRQERTRTLQNRQRDRLRAAKGHNNNLV